MMFKIFLIFLLLFIFPCYAGVGIVAPPGGTIIRFQESTPYPSPMVPTGGTTFTMITRFKSGQASGTTTQVIYYLYTGATKLFLIGSNSTGYPMIICYDSDGSMNLEFTNAQVTFGDDKYHDYGFACWSDATTFYCRFFLDGNFVEQKSIANTNGLSFNFSASWALTYSARNANGATANIDWHYVNSTTLTDNEVIAVMNAKGRSPLINAKSCFLDFNSFNDGDILVTDTYYAMGANDIRLPEYSSSSLLGVIKTSVNNGSFYEVKDSYISGASVKRRR